MAKVWIQKNNGKPIKVTEKAFQAVYSQKGYSVYEDEAAPSGEAIMSSGFGSRKGAAVAGEIGSDDDAGEFTGLLTGKADGEKSRSAPKDKTPQQKAAETKKAKAAEAAAEKAAQDDPGNGGEIKAGAADKTKTK